MFYETYNENRIINEIVFDKYYMNYYKYCKSLNIDTLKEILNNTLKQKIDNHYSKCIMILNYIINKK